MKFRWLAILSFVLASCASAPETLQGAPECTSEATQKVLTYCASPAAADLALETQQTRAALAGGTSLTELSPLPVGDSPVQGPADAPVTIVMFTDLECPYCAMAHAEFETLLEQRDDIRLVFKHTPLPFHENAVPASVAAMAAGEQGKFWEFVDAAYQNQDQLTLPALAEHAKSIGLDVEAFKASMSERKHLDAIQSDIDLAVRVGVRGTPTVFVNGSRLPNMLPAAEFAEVIEREKARVQRFIDAGVDPEEARWRTVAMNYTPPAAPPEEEPQEEPEAEIAYVPVDGRPSKGAAPADALVTIVEFSDFECPFCSKANPALEAALTKYPDKVRVVFRHLPLTQIHPNAVPAAVVANLAHEQGKFWELHDLLFANQQDLSFEKIKELALQVGVEEAAIEARFTDDGVDAPKLIEDMQLATQLGVRGTPAFFINGEPLFGAPPEAEFMQMVEAELANAEAMKSKTGLAGEELYEAVVEAKKESK